MEIQKEKRALRAQYRALREKEKSAEKDAAIAKEVLSRFGGYKRFFVYLSFGSEAGTEELISSLLALDKQVCVPRLRNGEMDSVPFTHRLIRGDLGILQPEEGEEETCEVALIPLLAADRAGYRLGYGGGYYDRYLAAHPEVLRVGLCYRAQLTEMLPHERGDIPLQFAVTERGLVTYPEER